MKNKMFQNIINSEDKESKFSDKKQKFITAAFTVCSHFVLKSEKPENHFMSEVAELKLKIIGHEEKNVGKKPASVPIYFKDEPNISAPKKYKKEDWEKKKNEPAPPQIEGKAKQRTEKKIVDVKEEGEFVFVKYNVTRSKFMTIKKPIRHIISALLGYYCNELVELRKEDKITPDLINAKGTISKFIYDMSKSLDVEKCFNSSIFGEYSRVMSEKFSKCDSDLDMFVRSEVTSRNTFGIDESTVISGIFKRFMYMIIKYCSVFKLSKFSISENLIYTILHTKFSDSEYDFKISDLTKALVKDCESATIAFKKTPVKKTGATTVPSKKPTVEVQPITVEETKNFDTNIEQFDVDGF